MAGQPNMYSRLFWLLIMHVSYFWAGIVRAQERSKNPLMWRWESQHGCIHCGRAIWCLPTLSWLRVRIDYNYLAARLAGQVVRRFSGRWFLLRETNAMNTGLYHPFISIYSDFGGTLVFFPACPPVRHEQPNEAVYHIMFIFHLLGGWSPQWVICSGVCNHKPFLVWGRWEGSHHVLHYPWMLWGNDAGALCRDGNLFDILGRCPFVRFLWRRSVDFFMEGFKTARHVFWICI